MAAKANSKPCQAPEMELFSQVVTGFRGELRISQTQANSDEAFCKNSQKLKVVYCFCKNLHLQCLIRF